MELDKRIIEGKRPLTCFDLKEAKQFIGKECYFSNYLCNFNDINSIAPRALLHNITEDKDASNPYYSSPGYFAYCLPCEWVKPEEPEKKYRPLSYKEFRRLFDVGGGVYFRRKGRDTAEFSMFIGYEIDTDGNRDEIPGEGKVNLGGNRYTLAELFEYYEVRLDGEWQPFGVIDEQGVGEAVDKAGEL